MLDMESFINNLEDRALPVKKGKYWRYTKMIMSIIEQIGSTKSLDSLCDAYFYVCTGFRIRVST